MKYWMLVSCSAFALLCATPLMAGGLDEAKRGLDFARRGQTDEAITSFDAALDSSDLQAEARIKTNYNKGTVLFEVGRPDLAVKSFDRALELDPSHDKALLNRAEALRSMGKHKEALASLDRAMKINNAAAEIHYARGMNLMALGQSEKAEGAFRKAVKDGDNPDHAVGLGRTLLARKKLTDAKDVLDGVLARHPEHAQAYLYRSLVYKAIGDKRKADKDLAAAARYDYNDPVIRSAYLMRRFGTKPAFYTTSNSVDAHSSPKGTAPVLNKLPKDSLIEASCNKDGWCRAMFGRRLAGYVKKSALSPFLMKP